MSELISRQAAMDLLGKQIEQCDRSLSSFDISMKDEYAVKVERASLVAFRETLEYMPPAQPAQHIDADGTLWITVPDIKQVKRVIVDEEKSKFCRQFYMEEEQRTGRWERHYSRPNVYADLCWHCSACGYYHADNWTNKFKYCPNCGAKMTEGDAE